MQDEIGALRRRLTIDMGLRRQKPGTGSLPLIEVRPITTDWPDLAGIFDGLRWAVVGAIAANRYMPTRATADIDIAVHPHDMRIAEERLTGAGYRREGALAIGGGAWTSPNGRQLDVIELAQAWGIPALEDALRARNPFDVPVMSLPYLVLMKVEATRRKDLGDVEAILGLAEDEQLDATRGVFARYAPELAQDLESLIALGKLQMRYPAGES